MAKELGKWCFKREKKRTFHSDKFSSGRDLECTVNAVNPGPVNTDMYGRADNRKPLNFLLTIVLRWSDTDGADAMTQRIMSETAAGSRIGETNDITPIVAFLCEEQSRWVSGSVTCANGGYVCV